MYTAKNVDENRMDNVLSASFNNTYLIQPGCIIWRTAEASYGQEKSHFLHCKHVHVK